MMLARSRPLNSDVGEVEPPLELVNLGRRRGGPLPKDFFARAGAL
jgi:hypothetical protein